MFMLEEYILDLAKLTEEKKNVWFCAKEKQTETKENGRYVSETNLSRDGYVHW